MALHDDMAAKRVVVFIERNEVATLIVGEQPARERISGFNQSIKHGSYIAKKRSKHALVSCPF
jgi:hypothetical protein